MEKNDDILLTNVDKKSQKSLLIYNCKICDYITFKKSDYDKHLLTRKHQNVDILLTNIDKKSQNLINKFTCNCGKKYSYRQSLFVHKKMCNFDKNNNNNNEKLVQYLMKENSELKNIIIDVCKNNTQNNHSFNHTNSHNKTFNLHFFLNETCKDAMNIMDFVESVKLQICDLEKVGEIGYINGISNIILKNLNALDETKRPVHCTDSKREILYIKDEDKWEKEDKKKIKIRKLIKKVADKNARLIPQFKKEHPDCVKSSSKISDQYNKIIVEAMGGSGDNDLEKENKIIKKIVKEIGIDKKKLKL